VLQAAECLQQRHWQLFCRRGQRHCCSPTATGGEKWAQLSAMRAQGRAGRAGRAGQGKQRDSGTGFEALKKNWNNQQSDALAIMTEDGGSWTVGGWIVEQQAGWPGWWAPAEMVSFECQTPSIRVRQSFAWPGQTRIDARLEVRCVEVEVDVGPGRIQQP